MILSLVVDSLEKTNIEKIIKEFDLTKLLIRNNDFNTIDEMLEKASIVVCEEDNELIEKCIKLNKHVIIYIGKRKRGKKAKEDNPLYYKKNVYTYTKKNEFREIIHFLDQKMKKKASIIRFSILALTVFVLAILILSTIKITNKNVDAKVMTTSIATTDTEKEPEKVDYTKENIVFYGDSITNFYDLEKFYPDLPVINSGTSGFQTHDLIDLVKERVYIYNPTRVFIMIGTNDIAFTDLTDEEIVANTMKVCKLIHKNRPNTKIYVESLYPINGDDSDNDIVNTSMVGKRTNERTKNVNKLLKEKCKENDVTYINLYDKLLDEDGDLKVEYSTDGLHISDEGYEVITKELMKYIEKKI